MGIGQKGISMLERQPDLLLSTLAAYVESLGGHVELVIGGERIPVGLEAFERQPAVSAACNPLEPSTAGGG